MQLALDLRDFKGVLVTAIATHPVRRGRRPEEIRTPSLCFALKFEASSFLRSRAYSSGARRQEL